MPDLLTLDVLDRPAGGALAGLRRLGRLRRERPAGVRALIRLGTGHFVPRTVPGPTPRRIGVLTVWQDCADGWDGLLGEFAGAASEHWHVRAQVTRASFTEPWLGWTPDTDGGEPLREDEPALILISGDLRARHVPTFLHDAGLAVAHAFRQPGYLGGLAIQSSPLNTTSCSAWRTYGDARAYAFRPGGHATAMRRDKAGEHHRTEWFLRLRPLQERGTLDGAAPFAGLLEREPTPAA